MSNKRIGTISIIISDLNQVEHVNKILHEFGSIIVGRMGIPYREKGFNIITLIIDGTTDQIGGITGKLGNLSGIDVKSALTK